MLALVVLLAACTRVAGPCKLERTETIACEPGGTVTRPQQPQ